MARTLFRSTLFVACLFGASAMISACNTVEGVGKDVSAGGKAVTGAAKSVKKKM